VPQDHLTNNSQSKCKIYSSYTRKSIKEEHQLAQTTNFKSQKSPNVPTIKISLSTPLVSSISLTILETEEDV